ncbi:MAG: universal stress protein [Anaerolineae bacterium]|nr:universal stress protein [Anaerolineales bacterium]MCQ3979231.1 universal stress protein [Anaerolineae bacterium]
MIKKILVSLDGSQLAEKALPYAQLLAQKFEAELVLVRVLHLSSDFVGGIPGIGIVREQVIRERVEAKSYLDRVLLQLRSMRLSAHAIIMDVHPTAEAIVDLAAEEAVDLIVISTHGRSGLSRWIYGSVASKVLQYAPCPVFLVRANESAKRFAV